VVGREGVRALRHEHPVLDFLRRWQGYSAGTSHIADVVGLSIPVVALTLRALALRGIVTSRASLHRRRVWMIAPALDTPAEL
jgi:DNA-binding MarR family transcriptional regulator